MQAIARALRNYPAIDRLVHMFGAIGLSTVGGYRYEITKCLDCNGFKSRVLGEESTGEVTHYDTASQVIDLFELI